MSVDVGEKRTSSRRPVSLTARCRIGNRHRKDAVIDLSRGGLYLATRVAASVGTPVRAAVALPDEGGSTICTLVGQVARLELDGEGRQRGLGVAFQPGEMDASDRQTLLGFIARLASA
jgi:hypothetical protein